MNLIKFFIVISIVSLILAIPAFAPGSGKNHGPKDGGFYYIESTNINPENVGAIMGTVTDKSSGSGISGATIAVDGNSTTTDDTGNYNISVVPNTYTVTASASGYQSDNAKVKILSGDTITQDFSLVPIPTNGTVTGTISNASSGTGIYGATVNIDGITTSTDRKGSYTISIMPGTYTETASSSGYQSSSSSITVTSGAMITQDFSLVPMPIPKIISTSPTSPIDVQSPSTVTFAVVTDQVADEVWILDNSIEQTNSSVTGSAFTTTSYVGIHKLVIKVKNQNGANSFTWDWNVKGQLAITADKSLVYIGMPTNISFKVTRACGIEQGDNCTNISTLPVSGATVSLNSTNNSIGSMQTDVNGQANFTLNVSSNDQIRATATKYLYKDSYVIVNAGVIPTPTQPPYTGGGGSSGSSGSSSGSSGGGGGGGGGGVASGEPYNNIFKYESQEEYISTVPVAFKYNTPEIAVYEVDVTGNQSDDVTLRVEALNGKSALVNMTAPGIVFKNINMWANSKRIKNATIKYKIENSWMDNNSVSADNIKMFRWDNNANQWNDLSTIAANRDNKYTYFESVTDGFSSFAISGLNVIALNQTNTNVPNDSGLGNMSGLDNSSSPDPTEVIGKKNVSVQFEIGVAVIIIILIAYTIKMKK